MLWNVACVSSLQLAFRSHREKGLLEGFSKHPSILCGYLKALAISMFTRVLYIHTASMAEQGVTLELLLEETSSPLQRECGGLGTSSPVGTPLPTLAW